jgi:hypothetical protein
MRRDKQQKEKAKAKVKRKDYKKALEKAEKLRIIRERGLKKRIFKELTRMNQKPV